MKTNISTLSVPLLVSVMLVASCEATLTVSDGQEDAGGSGGSPSDAGFDYASANVRAWVGNDVTCPEYPPTDTADCSVPEGQICAYWWTPRQGKTAYAACGCWEASSSTKQWACAPQVVSSYACPTVAPATGDGCFGFVGAECNYPPRVVCDCHENGTTPTWSCTSQGESFPPPPAELDPTTPISELTPAERQAWCNWYVFARLPAGSLEPPATSLSPEGYTVDISANYGGKHMCDVCLPSIPLSYCVGNLTLSTCAAPISELTDCVVTTWDSCWPSPHGCGRYVDEPGCSGTIALSNAQGDGGYGCPIRVQ